MNRNFSVYIHIFPNNKVYIGITSKNPKDRWDYGHGYLHQNVMNNAIKKYGWNNIEHKILFTNLTMEEAEEKEIELIRQYNSTDRSFGYNISTGGIKQKDRSFSCHPVLQYDLNGNFIKKYDSIIQASIDTNTSYNGIRYCLNKKQNKAGNFMWKEYDKNNFEEKIVPYRINGGRGTKTKFVPVAQIDDNGEIIKIWDGIKVAAQHFNVSDASIICAIKNNHKCQGYKWQRVKDINVEE